MKALTEEEIGDGIIQRFLGDITEDPLGEADLKEIGEKFEIDSSHLDEFCLLLNFGATRYQVCKKEAEVDWADVNAELAGIASSTTTPLGALTTLGPNSRSALVDSGFWRTIANAPSPSIVEQTNPKDGSTRLTLNSDSISANKQGEIDLAKLSKIQIEISNAATNAQTLIKSELGRKPNRAVFELVFFAFHAWTSAGQKPFKLRWFKDSSPHSTAADFLTDLAELVDPEITGQQLVSQSRKVRKDCKPLNNLQELPEFIENCSQTLL